MVKVITFGCRINSFESEILKEKLKNLDNVIIVNTCAVTAEAERQCRQTIRKLRKENPQARIIITGCAAQIAPQKFAQMEEVDLVLGNKEKIALDETYAEMADKYMEMFCKKTKTDKVYVQKWLPVVAAARLYNNIPEEQGLIMKWIDVVEYE